VHFDVILYESHYNQHFLGFRNNKQLNLYETITKKIF